MATSFSMDTIGFLQAINKLERRFEELVSPETMRKVCEDYDRDGTPTPWDHRLYALARDVFACGSWTTNLCAAAMSFNGRLVGECRRFLHGCSETVRKYGISVWLYELLNDSTLALFRDDPSDYMPSLIRMTTVEELMRRPRGRKRFGNRKQRGLAMEEHSTQMHRLRHTPCSIGVPMSGAASTSLGCCCCTPASACACCARTETCCASVRRRTCGIGAWSTICTSGGRRPMRNTSCMAISG